MKSEDEIEMLPLKPTLDSEDESFVSEKEPWTLQNWLHPPDLPRACQLLRKENIGKFAVTLKISISSVYIIVVLNYFREKTKKIESSQPSCSCLLLASGNSPRAYW